MMEFQLLGPVRAVRDGVAVPLSGSKANTVVAALVLADEHVVSDERLSTLLWGECPPSTMSAQLYTYVSRLRKLLDPEVRPVRRAPGYALPLAGSRVDVVDYRRLDRDGRAALAEGRWEDASTHLTAALALFSGPVLGNTTESLIEAEAAHWEEQRLETVQHLFEAELTLGRHHAVVADLAREVRRRPLCEQLRAQYMTALYRCGRQADALRSYHEGREQLAEDLGVDPGPGLTEAYDAVLHNTLGFVAEPSAPVVTATPHLAVAAPLAPEPTAPVVAPVVTPVAAPAVPSDGAVALRPVGHSLPLGAGAFVGRVDELATLDRVLAAPDPMDGPVTRRCLVTGLPGVGKTALVVRAAYRHRDAFADGHVYASLSQRDGSARSTTDVLTDLLGFLGALPRTADGDLDGLTAAYRALTASRRVLVVLDDVRSAEQVESLLPAGEDSACLMIGPAGLAAAAGATVLALAPLDTTTSTELLAAIVGSDRVAAEPEATARVVAQCAGLPLALRAVAGRLVARPGWGVGRCADVLERPDTRLAQLSAGDLDVARALETRWRRVSPADALDIGVLARLDGVDITLRAAADVLELDTDQLDEAEERMAVLAGRALVEQLPAAHPGSEPTYRINSLLRLFVLFGASPRPGSAGVQELPVSRPTGLRTLPAAAPQMHSCATESAPAAAAHASRTRRSRQDAMAMTVVA